MPVPKSAKLLREEETKKSAIPSLALPVDFDAVDSDEVIKIREIPCLNDFVAILVSKQKMGNIHVPDDQQYKNEGVVVGIGGGVADAGHRVPSQLKIGDVVLFQQRSIVLEVNSSKPPYQGKRVVILSERNLICKLPAVQFEVIKTDAAV